MIFKDWRICDQSLVPLELDKSRFYYLQAQAWHLKGYLGGTHSYSTFWSNQHESWLVVELTDYETVSYQGGEIEYTTADEDEPTKHAPFIHTRPYNAKWFGHSPYIVDSCDLTVNYQDVRQACDEYPIQDFVLLSQNCNTFTSYLIWRFGLPLRRPFRSFGFKSGYWWRTYT